MAHKLAVGERNSIREPREELNRAFRGECGASLTPGVRRGRAGGIAGPAGQSMGIRSWDATCSGEGSGASTRSARPSVRRTPMGSIARRMTFHASSRPKRGGMVQAARLGEFDHVLLFWSLHRPRNRAVQRQGPTRTAVGRSSTPSPTATISRCGLPRKACRRCGEQGS
jgi:hypothetical protein